MNPRFGPRIYTGQRLTRRLCRKGFISVHAAKVYSLTLARPLRAALRRKAQWTPLSRNSAPYAQSPAKSGTSKRQARCVRMTRIPTDRPVENDQTENVGLSDGCRGNAVPLAAESKYDFRDLGAYLGNVGLCFPPTCPPISRKIGELTP